MNISNDLKTVLDNINKDIAALDDSIPSKTSQLTNDSGFITDSALTGKLDAPSGGTKGQVLTKTANGEEWADANGSPIVVVEEKNTSGAFTVDFTGAPIQKYDITSCPTGAVTFDYANLSGVADNQASTIEVQLPIIDTAASSITFPNGTQVLDMPEELESTVGKFTYHDIVFRNQHGKVYTNYAYKYNEDIDYFWVEMLNPSNDGEIAISDDGHWDGSEYDLHLEYSYDKETWMQPDPSVGNRFDIENGQRVYLRSTQLNNTWSKSSSHYLSFFDAAGDERQPKFKVGGNIMTLVDGSGKSNAIPAQYYFTHLFDDKSCVGDASELILPATSLPMGAYYQMFYNNTALSAAPAEIPDITTVGIGMFFQAFTNCTHLTKAPIIKIKNFGSQWAPLYQMFKDCTSLNEIEVHFDNWSGNNPTVEWLSNVAASGTFKCPASLPIIRGISNIPEGWTIVNI